MSTEEEEARKIAEMGKPVLGEHSRLEVVIEESYEFKVTVENIESSQCIFDLIFKESYEFSLRFQIWKIRSHLKTVKLVSPYLIKFSLLVYLFIKESYEFSLRFQIWKIRK